MTNIENKSLSPRSKPLLIIDGYGFIFRAYHVQPTLMSPAGKPVGALYGFTSMLIKLISEFKPEHAVIVLDSGGKTFRHEIYKEYKAHRPPLTQDLIDQLKLVTTVADALNFRHLSKGGFEADDIIATLAAKASSEGREAIIISSDKDLMQLVDGYVKMYDPSKSKFISAEDIIEKFGVPASKVRDMLALIGDKSDNIPGVPGIGPKTAVQLINEYGALHEIINSVDNIANVRWQKLLKDNIDKALLSWELVGLDKNVHIEEDIENFQWTPPILEQISGFLNEHGFKSLHKRIENLWQLKIEHLVSILPLNEKTDLTSINIENLADLNNLIERARNLGMVAIFYQTIEDSKHSLILNLGDNFLYHIDYSSQANIDKANDLFSYSNKNNINHEIRNLLSGLFQDKSIKKITYDLKTLLHLIKDSKSDKANETASFEDLMLMDYVLNAGNKLRTLPEVIETYAKAHVSDTPNYPAYFIDCYNVLLQQLVDNKALHLYSSIDLPLCYILHDMENEGIKIDIAYLKQMSLELEVKLKDIEQQIFSLAGREFNIASPKQLGVILFEEMKLPFGKPSGKSKAYSTNVDILEKLQIEGFEIAQMLLDYRHLSKLKNTYTDSLPTQAKGNENRIHTTFLQCVTTTGRLSSINPNLQNIPIRTEEGNKIRAAFIAPPGKKLISADYSQIELRILSHVADIKSLKQAFMDNKDIHTETASQIFDIPLAQVDPDTRRKAKAINFGIIYGISSFGLAKQLNIPRKEAGIYIEKYFEKYPGIKDYMSRTIEYSKENGFIANLLGRKCFLPHINSKEHIMRSFSERAAINAPMQSLASDIVKIAMILVGNALKDNNMKTKMILQIHDELLFEAPDDEIEKVSAIIKSTMQNAYALDVAMDTKVRSGKNWQEL